MKENALIFFLKLPSKGKVKTRLEKDLGSELVLALCDAFITDILTACGSVNADILIAYSPDNEAEDKYKPLLDRYKSFKQYGIDLGERMYNAFCDAYAAGYKRSVLIGSDIPGITDYILNEAFLKLEQHDIVIGPSADGGYYLIGNKINSNSNLYFRNIEWSRPDVYDKTADKISSNGYTWFKDVMLNDIDELADLLKFFEINKNNLTLESVKVILNKREFIPGK